MTAKNVTRKNAGVELPVGADGSAPDLNELLLPEQAAVVLGGKRRPIALGTLAVWRCRRKYCLPFVKVGARVMYRRLDLENFLKARTRSGGDEPAVRVPRRYTRRKK